MKEIRKNWNNYFRNYIKKYIFISGLNYSNYSNFFPLFFSILMIALKLLHASHECVAALNGLSVVARSTETTH